MSRRPAEGSWSRPPFRGEVADGYVWGRGALDMKGGVAMMLAAFLQAAEADTPPPGDVLCLLSDEEAGGLGADPAQRAGAWERTRSRARTRGHPTPADTKGLGA